MGARAVSPALAERLGPDATVALVELIDASEKNVVEMVLTQSVERFERRLAEETSALRVEMATLGSDLRREMTLLGSGLRQEMSTLGSELRQEIASQKFDLLKWSFLFWIGQVGMLAAILALLART